MEDLKSNFYQLVSGYISDAEMRDGLWREIEMAYSQKKRYYHNLNHLNYMLRLAKEHREDLEDWEVVLFSIFYHDIVYNVKRKDNEDKSAKLAAEKLTLLGLEPKRIDRCKSQIRATKHHELSEDSDTAYLIDFDLAILGDTWEKYCVYAQNIRKEYAIYPDFLYERGRKKVVESFLNSERIFKTDKFFKWREENARANLRRELEHADSRG